MCLKIASTTHRLAAACLLPNVKLVADNSSWMVVIAWFFWNMNASNHLNLFSYVLNWLWDSCSLPIYRQWKHNLLLYLIVSLTFYYGWLIMNVFECKQCKRHEWLSLFLCFLKINTHKCLENLKCCDYSTRQKCFLAPPKTKLFLCFRANPRSTTS